MFNVGTTCIVFARVDATTDACETCRLRLVLATNLENAAKKERNHRTEEHVPSR
jgi:hypothetical protein